MFSLNTGINARLFQPWQPPATSGQSQIHKAAYQSEFIELPEVHCYEELEAHASFLQIKSRFLSDIQEMKRRVRPFVNNQYDKSIDAFYNKLNIPPEYLKNSLLPMYRETRFQIHQLVVQLRDQRGDANVDSNNYITSVLHECLNGIGLCFAGVHSRFNQSFLDFEASRAGLDGKLFKVRKALFHHFIQSFLLEQQRERLINISGGMEIHWFNSFHNLFCEALGLSLIVDPMAPTNLSDDLTRRFLSAASLSVNACTILRELSSEWASQLSTTLQQMGVQAWETKAIAPDELTSDRTGTLESKLFKPVNHILKTTEEQSFGLWTVIEETGDGNYYLGRYREKLLARVASHFSESSAQVFTAITGGDGSTACIGTINEIFFWVFTHDQRLPPGQACTFDADNHITLTLSHLASIDFSTWPETTSYALLTQAMEQTDKAEHIALFFLQHAAEQIRKTPTVTVKALSSQLCDKLIKHGDTFIDNLCQCVCDHFASDRTIISPDSLDWLINTPLLKPVLLGLQQQGMDVSPITRKLASWQISAFSHDDMKKLLTPDDCQRLFRRAFKLRQVETLSNLLLAGHCDQLTSLLNTGGESPLIFFARSGHLPGLEYLLQLPNPKVNQQDILGFTPLNIAARRGHLACVRALLPVEGIDVNRENNLGFTPLNSAARAGHARCVRALLTADGIDVNKKNNDGWTPLNCAARYGYVGCVRALLTVNGIDVNKKNNGGWTPLIGAAVEGHAGCVRALLTGNGIDVNKTDNDGWTPLHRAAYNGRLACVRALLIADGVQVNRTNYYNDTALILSIKLEHTECARLLINDPRTNLNKINLAPDTALTKARRKGLADIVRLLEADSRLSKPVDWVMRVLR